MPLRQIWWTWKITSSPHGNPGTEGGLHPSDPHSPPHPRAPRSRGPPWEKLLPLQGLLHLSVPFMQSWSRPGWDIIALLQAFSPTTRDSTSLQGSHLIDRTSCPHQVILQWEQPWTITLIPWQGDHWNRWSQVHTPYYPNHLGHHSPSPASLGMAGLSALPGLSGEECPLVVGVPISLILSGSRWEDSHGDCVLLCSGGPPCWPHPWWPQGSAPPVPM